MFVRSQPSTLAAQPWRPTAAGRQDDRRRVRRQTKKNVLYRVIDGPIGRLGLAEAAVGEVSGGDGDVLTGAGEEQQGAVHDDHVPVPVLTASPAATLHLQEAGAKTQLYMPQRLIRTFTHCLNNWTSTVLSELGGDACWRPAVQPHITI